MEYRLINDASGYRVGTDGSIWTRHPRGPKTGRIWTNWKRMKCGTETRHGYATARLRYDDGTERQRLVHVLVLETFTGTAPAGMQARHFPDRDPKNNAITNLRWGTAKQNAEDRERDGNTKRGSSNNRSKLKESDIPAIRAATGRGCVGALAAKYGVSRQVIWQIRSRKTWIHV